MSYKFFFIRLGSYFCLYLLLFSCNKKKEAHTPLTRPNDSITVQDQAIANTNETANWLAYGRTHYERRFSPVSDINDKNVGGLKIDWYMDLPYDVGLVATPLVLDGVLYFTGTMNVIRAVDAKTGELIWEFDPEVAEHIKGKRQAGWVHNRGLSYYNNKIFLATWDGRLISLDAKTGKKVWSVVTFDPSSSLYITGTPKAFSGKVVIGNGGTEEGPTRGFVTAYDTETGEEAWKFYIVPGNPADGFENEAMEMAAKTWTGEWWKHGGGGNAWHGFTYDPDLDVLYIGTGNGAPWNRKIRSPGGGDNLFLCAIVALNPHTGEYLWHYQTTPGESWDYNSNMDIVLADLTIDGKPVKAILHAPKNGFFYVIDRQTGKLISAEPFVETTWASHIDKNTGRPVEIEGARYENGPYDITPDYGGAHSWQAMSYNPQTGLVYIPTMHSSLRFSDEGIDLKNFQAEPFSRGVGVNISYSKKQPRDYPSSLQAWDPVKQKAAWSIPQDEIWNGGTLTTAGNLVFQGRSDGKFLAYNASTGDQLFEFDAGLGISAPPITYKLDGRQYISVLVGYGGGAAGLYKPIGWSYGVHTRRLLTFSLEGKVDLPDLPPPYFPKPIVAEEFEINSSLAEKGGQEFGACLKCHGIGAIAAGMAPDLRASIVPLSEKEFESVVRNGARNERGMPTFPDLNDEQLLALRHYIRQRAAETSE